VTRKKDKHKTVYVAMSGGVDSSLAAALLKEQGYGVTGVFFKPWQPDNNLVFCNWEQDRVDALKVAVKLKIPFLTWDFSKEYQKKVTNYMISSYRKGITPNPDVMCNKEIKFGSFLKKAQSFGADFIATGHYVKLKSGQKFQLLKAKDRNKDQSYFLWTLIQKQLKHCLFPIGEYTKPEVRKLAKKFKLPNWNKKDSQGVCFVGDLDMKEFLKEYIKPNSGVVKNLKGAILGSHDGVSYYTIGQRHGFSLNNAGGPYFVVRKDTKNNILYVDKNMAKEREINVKNISWVNNAPKFPFEAYVKIRYRHNSQKAQIYKKGSNGAVSLKFSKPQSAITPGQSAVFYSNNQLLGGGIIQ